MALVSRLFSVNITPGAMPPIVHVSEYDVGRAYTVSILDEQGNTFTIPTGTTASIEGTLNGKVGFTQSASISNNQVSFTLTESMTAYSGKAWCKIKLTLNSEPIQTCAFILAVDRAGVEADTILHSPGFQEQINEGIAEYFDNDPPFFELPSGGQSGQALVSDGEGGAEWGQAQGGGSGLSDEAKQALLSCFQNVVWLTEDWETLYNALRDALYPPVNLSYITARFNQGQNVIYTTDSLDTLKQYLIVTAHYSDSSAQNVTGYTLSGTLTAGTSTITVSYGGKTTTFTVNVSGSARTLTVVIGGSDPTTDVRNTNDTRRQTDVPVATNSNGQQFTVSANASINSGDGVYFLRFYDTNGNYIGPFENGDSTPSHGSFAYMKADGTEYTIVSVNRDSAKLSDVASIRFIFRYDDGGGTSSSVPITSFSGTVNVNGLAYELVEE